MRRQLTSARARCMHDTERERQAPTGPRQHAITNSNISQARAIQRRVVAHQVPPDLSVAAHMTPSGSSAPHAAASSHPCTSRILSMLPPPLEPLDTALDAAALFSSESDTGPNFVCC
jgi:hypothetical protein